MPAWDHWHWENLPIWDHWHWDQAADSLLGRGRHTGTEDAATLLVSSGVAVLESFVVAVDCSSRGISVQHMSRQLAASPSGLFRAKPKSPPLQKRNMVEGVAWEVGTVQMLSDKTPVNCMSSLFLSIVQAEESKEGYDVPVVQPVASVPVEGRQTKMPFVAALVPFLTDPGFADLTLVGCAHRDPDWLLNSVSLS